VGILGHPGPRQTIYFSGDSGYGPHFAQIGERLSQLAAAAGQTLLTPRFGERVDLHRPQPTKAWWREVVTAPAPAPAAATVSATMADAPR
jgi:hypothetical protein